MNEVYFKDTLLDLPDHEVVAINKFVNNIGELSLRKSDFTREFKVKRTREMEKLFENAGLINSQTNIPYGLNDCIVLVGGLEQIRKGRAKLIRRDDDYYYISVYSGAKNIFDDIGKLTLNDLDLSDLSHTWGLNTCVASVENDLDYQYLLFDSSDDGGIIPNTSVGPPSLSAAANTLRPFVKLKRIWDQIWIDQGITVASDADSNALFLRMFQIISTTKTSSFNISSLLVRYHSPQTSLPTGVRTNLNLINKESDPSNLGMYKARVTGKHYFSLIILRHDGLLDVNINGVVASVDIIEVVNEQTFLGPVPTIYFSIDLVSSDRVDLFYTAGTGFNSIATCSCINIEPTSIGYGSLVNPEMYLEGMKQSDFVKAVCNYFCLIPDYDPLTNTLNFWSLNNILKNRIIAKDWSAFLSVDDSEMSYAISGYEQKNTLKWKEGDDIGAGNGDGYITCNNQNLEKEKELIKLPISFCDSVIHQGEAMARIAWYKSTEGSSDYTEQESISTRWVTKEDTTLAVTYTYGGYTHSVSSPKKASSEMLSIGKNINFYAAVQNMITNPKLLTVKMNLPSVEIQNLNHAIPIFLEQYSEYFYVNQVKNWMDGYICDVELIRI